MGCLDDYGEWSIRASRPISRTAGWPPEQPLGGEPTGAKLDSRPPTDRPDQPRSAGRIKAIPLTAEDSARLRDRRLSEIAGLACEEDLDAWSIRSWREANVLASADGARLRQALRHG